MKLPKLNLPEYDFRISYEEGECFVWDDFRKKNVLLTLEEWVRQNFLMLLVHDLGYPKSMIKVESGLNYNRKMKRSDIRIMKSTGEVFLLVECKAPNVQIDQKALNQIAVYNKALDAPYIAITNGMKHYFWEFNKEDQEYLTQNEPPIYVKDD